MAMSFSRPDPGSPAQVADATFSTGRRGFDQNEVRDFLRMVSAELSRLQEREVFLEREVQDLQANTDLSTARMDDETLTRLLGEETARVLNAARESGHEIREKAEQAAAQMLMEASDEATRLREEAEIEASRRRADAANDAEAELSMAKQQGREMVNEARAYRERVLSELARRRELAREQIEQLVHGRDRLMQAFERARLVAVDVVAEMQPLGEPDEYVNLQPSTGPVPVMVAREAMAESAGDGDGSVSGEEAVADDAGADADDHDDAVSTDADDLRIVDADDDNAEPGSDSGSSDAVADPADVELADADADAEADAVDAEQADAEQADAEAVDVEGGSAEADPDDGSVDDVVVDLFARLRGTEDVDADGDGPDPSASSVDEADDTGLETDGESDDESDVEREPTPFEQRDADVTPLIVASARKLKRVLADEQNEVLDALRRNDPVRNLDALLPWSSHHAERYASEIEEELLAAANAGAALTAEGRPKKLRKAAGQQAVQQAAETIARALVAPLRDRLERCVVDGDGDNPAITKKVRAVYREWKTQHIDEQLDDVFRAAHGRGVLASVELDSPVAWTPDPSHEVCPDCDDNRLAGNVPAGQPFPTGHVCTPAHPGCRCLLLPAGG